MSACPWSATSKQNRAEFCFNTQTAKAQEFLKIEFGSSTDLEHFGTGGVIDCQGHFPS